MDWEVFMQIRKVLRNYLATMLMDVLFLEMNLTFCFSCQKGFCVVIYAYGWLDLTREHLMYFVHGNESKSRPVGGSPQAQWRSLLTGERAVTGGPPKWQNILPLPSHWIPLRNAMHLRHTWSCTSSGEKRKLSLSSNHVPRTVCIYSTKKLSTSMCLFCRHWRYDSVYRWLHGGPPSYVHILTLRTCEYDLTWTRGLFNCNCIKDLEMKGSWIMCVGPKFNVVCPNKRHTKKQHKGKEEKPMWRQRQRSEWCGREPRHIWNHEKLE